MTELSPEKSHAMISSLMNFAEGIIYIYLTIFFKMSENKDVKYPLMYGVCNNYFYMLVLFFIPESPKWLYEQQRYKECVEVF